MEVKRGKWVPGIAREGGGDLRGYTGRNDDRRAPRLAACSGC